MPSGDSGNRNRKQGEQQRRLKEARRQSDMTQEQVAAAIRVDWRTVSAYETGRVKPSGPALVALSNLYGKAVDWLAGGSVGPEVPDPPVPVALTADEMKIVSQYRSIPGNRRELMRQILETAAGYETKRTAAGDQPEEEDC